MALIERLLLYYVPAATVALILNGADIYFLQTEQRPALHRSVSFWLYLGGHLFIALFAAWLMYNKLGVSRADWPIVAVASALVGFSVIQSFTLKFGEKGVDARELFDSWKRRVIEDLGKINASDKRMRQSQIAVRLADSLSISELEAQIHLIAESVGTNAGDVLGKMRATGINVKLLMAQWIVSADLSYAEGLLKPKDSAIT